MTHDPLANVTSALKGAVAETGDVGAMPEGRDAAIAKLADALVARARVRRRHRVMGALAVAASIVAALGATALIASRRPLPVASSATELGRVREPAGAVTAVRAGQAESLGAGARVAEGTELSTAPGAEAHLDFDTGTGVTLGGAARVRLVEQSKKKRFALTAGWFSARVAKLAAEERFVVATSDAEIEVRGTAFRVSIAEGDPACAGGTPTRLEVTEGVVVVRHGGEEITVATGERWPACAARASAPPVGTEPATATATASATANANANATPNANANANAAIGTTAPAAGSHLSDQNDLYDDAMKARREGRNADAIATLERLLASYPRGPLAENAAVERMRLLATTDRSRARTAARDYLAAYPHGFARPEAEALAGVR